MFVSKKGFQRRQWHFFLKMAFICGNLLNKSSSALRKSKKSFRTPPSVFLPAVFPHRGGGIKEMSVSCILYVFFGLARAFAKNPLYRVFSFFPSWGKCWIFALKMFVSKKCLHRRLLYRFFLMPFICGNFLNKSRCALKKSKKIV